MRTTWRYMFYCCFLTMAAYDTHSQVLLTPEEAIKEALGNNYSIIISGKQADIAGNNATACNAGMYPSLDITGRQNNASLNVKQNYVDGRVINKTGAASNSLDAGIQLNWTVFDGMNMFIERDKLEKQKELSDISLKEKIENAIYQVLSAYYDIVKQYHLIKSAGESLSISRERLSLIRHKFDAGAASRMELLQAQSGLNNDILDSLDKVNVLKNLKTALNNILGRNGNPDFVTTEEIDTILNTGKNYLLNSALQNNTGLLSARKDSSIGALDIELYKSEYYPRISLYGGYYYSYLSSESGLQSENTTTGLNFGVNLSFNIFDGMNTSRKIENAKIESEVSGTIIRQIEADILAALEREYNNYSGLKDRLIIESLNLETARESMQLALERLNAGKISQIEFRDIQDNFIKAGSRLWETKAGIAKSITAMKLIAGELVN